MPRDDPPRHGRATAPDTHAEAGHTGGERPLGQAMRRGWRRRCPSCGDGPAFSGYLKVRSACPVCDEDLHHQRADDGPAYLTILLVGHLMAPVLHVSFVAFEPDPLILATILCLAFGGLSLWLLPRIKGAFVALQWAKRMHGFGEARPAEAGFGG
jgi:uncharacterized protein (DUF983 family)